MIGYIYSRVIIIDSKHKENARPLSFNFSKVKLHSEQRKSRYLFQKLHINGRGFSVSVFFGESDSRTVSK